MRTPLSHLLSSGTSCRDNRIEKEVRSNVAAYSACKSLLASQFKVTAHFNLSRQGRRWNATMNRQWQTTRSKTTRHAVNAIARPRCHCGVKGRSLAKVRVGGFGLSQGWCSALSISFPQPLYALSLLCFAPSPFHFVPRSGMQASSKLFQSGRNFVPVIKATWILDGLIHDGYSVDREWQASSVGAKVQKREEERVKNTELADRNSCSASLDPLGKCTKWRSRATTNWYSYRCYHNDRRTSENRGIKVRVYVERAENAMIKDRPR